MDSQLIQFLITGITTGSIYAFIAIGFVTVYNVTGILNFAQGEFVAIGALTCISLVKMGLPLPVAILLAVAITALVAIIMERTTIAPARHSSLFMLISITIGVSVLLKGISLLIWGTNPLTLDSFSNIQPIQIFGAVLISQNIWIIFTLGLILGLLYLFFEKTVLGSALKACVINRKAAQLMGINTEKMSALAFAMSGAIGALAGILLAPISSATYDMGLLLTLKGFVALVLGGMHSVSGAVVGGLLLGIIEAFSSGYISTTYSEAFSFIILLLVLFLSPNGLLVKVSGKRV
ncbi:MULTISPECIES: branched-chain amino acid ABC transporter permease [unclassified Paenibacillus]|uniref:branched-chain amino acid ABC transporter permease n=1 Tax=unclassified Paenibacillus TaxID=185978 RepID=UPI001AE0F725|nr:MULTISPECIES: branched-chain amino acid ABC transporter permease [unclassified Paenibacillus]MBP1157180.1 branched-chain amino acid transport system permease protein [Paenibacillus sp. PvP091]MBP1172081.1 branched-chain amino acid transport system permease protein [Paenibacillus sp. PvR098]MBP2438462.1 branched-chain amino acid transport system permease protein [Paenibacillus sp. PvP052]